MKKTKNKIKRNSIIATTILFTILFAEFIPCINLPVWDQTSEEIWYEPNLADYLYEDSINETVYEFNAMDASYIICKIQNTDYTSFTFNETQYPVSYGLNMIPIDFGTENSSYSITISQDDVDNNVFDYLCVQPLSIDYDIIDVNLKTPVSLSLNMGGMKISENYMPIPRLKEYGINL
ncbi:MAG: hypothetical protein ACTSP9_08005 [Promethearchaeota archaeon]